MPSFLEIIKRHDSRYTVMRVTEWSTPSITDLDKCQLQR